MERVETDFIDSDSFIAEKNKTPSLPAYDMISLAYKFARKIGPQVHN
jgi:hypothetical protein